MERKAKIVCTIGPACRDARTLGKLLAAGMNVARLNFSHGTEKDHRAVFERLRRLKSDVTIMQDLAGPKLRIGEMANGWARLRDGETFTLTTRDVAGDERQAHVDYTPLPGRVKGGDDLYLSDGIIHLKVEKVRARDIVCRIVDGGVLTSRKGLNVPRLRVNPVLSAKDRSDLECGLAMGVDYVAVSFVTRAAEIMRVKHIIRDRKSPALVVAKIEKEEALRHLESIIEVSDAIMIARGDLGVEVAPERVPVLQKQIIERSRMMGKPVIVATQMLESMVSSERPTRAEASDVANAVFDRADALMLSAETATGQYPVESVAMMDRIIREAEGYYGAPSKDEWPLHFSSSQKDIAEVVCAEVAKTAWNLGSHVIACLTHSGRTARLIARYRPRWSRIIVLTDNPEVVRQMGLVWGAETILIGRIRQTDEIFPLVTEKLKEVGIKGRVVLTTGIPVSEKGFTNSIHIVST